LLAAAGDGFGCDGDQFVPAAFAGGHTDGIVIGGPSAAGGCDVQVPAAFTGGDHAGGMGSDVNGGAASFSVARLRQKLLSAFNWSICRR